MSSISDETFQFNLPNMMPRTRYCPIHNTQLRVDASVMLTAFPPQKAYYCPTCRAENQAPSVLRTENKPKNRLMRFDPRTGDAKPYPSHAEQFREYHGKEAWLYSPWDGTRRSAKDVAADVFGEEV